MCSLRLSADKSAVSLGEKSLTLLNPMCSLLENSFIVLGPSSLRTFENNRVKFNNLIKCYVNQKLLISITHKIHTLIFSVQVKAFNSRPVDVVQQINLAFRNSRGGLG
ncbi:unnamed protein product [Cuscuta europaea]|uniref:Uncharacterized protein n=1 Tax=Cuscuta europaea TaxID=41803 RepID=A0A9P1EKA9_CUSEU|nr:unnamed protein product [Cuscuta europaea]